MISSLLESKMKRFILNVFAVYIYLMGFVYSDTISSSLYIPEVRKIVSNTKLGYVRMNFKNSESNKKKFEKYYFIEENGKFGLFENIFVNFGFQYNVDRRMFDEKLSSDFSKFYFGTTDRILNNTHSKIDLTINFGKDEMQYFIDYEKNYIELSLKYGLEFSKYMTSLKLNYIHNSNYRNQNKDKINNSYVLSIFYDNQFIISDKVSFDINLFINHNNKIKENKSILYKSYNEYGGETVINYSLNNNNILSIYYLLTKNNIKINLNDIIYKTKITNSFGFKVISQF